MLKHIFVLTLLVIFAISDKPQQIFIGLTGKGNDVTISWVSKETNDAFTPIVRYGYSSQSFTNIARGSARRFECYWHKFNFQEVTLVDLQPNQKVYYIASNNGTEWSDEKWFIAPDVSTKKFNFITFGDTDITTELRGIVDRLLKEYESVHSDPPKLILHSGDYAYADPWSMGKWDVWGQILEPVTSKIPYMYAVGNHEYPCSFQGYRDRFSKAPGINSNSNTNLWYSFDYSLVHFVIGSSEHDYNATSEQFKWLVRDLEKVNRKVTPYVLFFAHQPMYCSNVNHGSNVKFRNAIEPVLTKYKVDAAIFGHVHAYERTCAVVNEVCQDGNPVHVYAGTGGRYLYTKWHPKPVWSIYRESQFGVIRAWVDASEIHFKFIRTNGTIADQFSIPNRFWKN